ncbi:YbdD/YjiX family protein [Mycetocola zhujimingii]|nr:YbdD/YjiX family protein [Mycetocola zhujimingii]
MAGSLVARAPAMMRDGLASIARYVRAIMGDNAYEVYLAHHRSVHGDALPMPEKLFWRERDDVRDREPQGRCC